MSERTVELQFHLCAHVIMSALLAGLALIAFEESREIAVTRDGAGRALFSTPVEGSEHAVVVLQLPNGEAVRAVVSHADFHSKLAPLLNPDA
jgi:3-hydroxyisobutyrate dehydrogenase-like beta-hydroxyacid dehydrogenase